MMKGKKNNGDNRVDSAKRSNHYINQIEPLYHSDNTINKLKSQLDHYKRIASRQRTKESSELSTHTFYFDFSPVPSLLVSEEGLIMAINLAAKQLMESNPSSKINSPIDQFIKKQDKTHFKRMLNTCRQDKTIASGTITFDCLFEHTCNTYCHIIYTPEHNDDPHHFYITLQPITSSQNDVNQLQEQSNLYKSIVESLPDAIYVKDRESQFIFANQTCIDQVNAENITRLIGKSDFDFIRKEKAQMYRDGEMKVITTGKPLINMDMTCQCHDGTKQLSITKVPWRNANGEILGTIGINRDVSDLKKVRDELSHERNLLQTLMNTIPDIIFAKDLKHRYVFVNQAAVEMMNCQSQEDVIGKSLCEIKPSHLSKLFKQDERLIFNKQKPFTSREYQCPDKYGTMRWYASTKVPWRNEEGEIIGIVGVNRDITIFKETEIQLRQSEQRFRSLYQCSPLGYQSLNEEGCFLDVNPAWLETLGYEKDEVIGKWFGDFLTESSRESFKERFKNFIKTGTASNVHLDMVRKDGKHIIAEFDGSISCDINGVIRTHCILHDITERRITEMQRERLSRQLEAKHKELESVIYIVSHDLSSPLINIDGYGKILLQGCHKIYEFLQQTALPDTTKTALEKHYNDDVIVALEYISNSTKKIQTMLSGLLRLSRAGTKALNSKTVDMTTCINDTLSMLKDIINKKNVDITVDPLANCFGDNKQICTIFFNILDNAIKFLDPTRKGKIHITAQDKKGFVIYCIKDNGVGIHPKYKENIFEIFNRISTKRSFSGDGLGLAIASRMVERNHGRIWFNTAQGEGTCFYIMLPTKDISKKVKPPYNTIKRES